MPRLSSTLQSTLELMTPEGYQSNKLTIAEAVYIRTAHTVNVNSLNE